MARSGSGTRAFAGRDAQSKSAVRLDFDRIQARARSNRYQS